MLPATKPLSSQQPVCKSTMLCNILLYHRRETDRIISEHHPTSSLVDPHTEGLSCLKSGHSGPLRSTGRGPLFPANSRLDFQIFHTKPSIPPPDGGTCRLRAKFPVGDHRAWLGFTGRFTIPEASSKISQSYDCQHQLPAHQSRIKGMPRT
jgi:hypothetical protein